MDKNRPRGREKNFLGGSSNVSKKGSGLGTGPVGNYSSGGGRRTGPRAGGISFGTIAIILIFLLIRFCGSGGSGSSGLTDVLDSFTGGDSGFIESVSSGASNFVADNFSGKPDMTVASGSRAKRTVIKGNNNDIVTIMVYMCGTDLESRSAMATKDINEMLKADLNDNINLLIYTGGCKKWNNNIISSSKNQIYQIKDKKFVCLEDNMGSDSMVKPETLTSFINYCKKNFPANRNELIFWDHGSGSISGYGYDEKNPLAGSMTLDGIYSALQSANVTFDFIGFDACLMATLENGLILEKFADYMVASEETEPGIGWYYSNWLTKFAQNPGMDTLTLGKYIADDFTSACNRECNGQKTTLSVVDLAELVNTVPSRLTKFARSTANIIQNSDYKKVSKARKGTREFAQSSKIDQIDIIHFCENLNTTEASDLAAAIRGAVKYNRTSASITNANGLSIYFPYQKTNKVNNATRVYNKIGMDDAYTRCIQEFASTEVAGQVSAGGNTSPFPSLSDTLSSLGGNSSGGSSDLLSGLLDGILSGGSSNSTGLDTSILNMFLGGRSNKKTIDYVADNYFNADNLVWQVKNGKKVIDFDESQWDLIDDIEINMFLDDGEGYIDLGLDNPLEFDDDGALVGDTSGTWLSINGQVVPYYHIDTTEYSDDEYSITGYVPCFYNSVRAELLLTFDSDNPKGYISGVRYVYEDDKDIVAKNVVEVKPGDVIEPICDYYSYDGTYQDSYMLDARIVLKENNVIGDKKVTGGKLKVTYRFSDIYNQKYWTEVLK
ncbi:MAG: hypothetical protein K6E97_00480 [Treponema sp.]|nr:hypothetical protein [Treponema sp.]